MTSPVQRPITVGLAAVGLVAGLAGLAGCSRGSSRTAAPARAGDCIEVCVVEDENRGPMQLDVVLRDGLSVRTIGAVAGYATASFELPAGIHPRNVDARIAPGAASIDGRRAVTCQLRSRGAENAARLVCDQQRG
jgi:hypothetical protein